MRWVLGPKVDSIARAVFESLVSAKYRCTASLTAMSSNFCSNTIVYGGKNWNCGRSKVHGAVCDLLVGCDAFQLLGQHSESRRETWQMHPRIDP